MLVCPDPCRHQTQADQAVRHQGRPDPRLRARGGRVPRLLPPDGPGPRRRAQQTALKVAHVCDLFLSHAEKHNEPKTFARYRKYLQSFCDLFGTLGALDVKPLHVTRWLDAHPRWTTSHRCAVVCVKRAYNECEAEGILTSNPLKKVRKPPAVRRERILTPDEWKHFFAAVRDSCRLKRHSM